MSLSLSPSTAAKYGTPPNESNNDGEPGLPKYYSPEDEAQTQAHNDAISNLDEAGEGWAFRQYIEEHFGEQAWEHIFGDDSEDCAEIPESGECPLHANYARCGTPCIGQQTYGCDIASLPFEEADGLYDFVYDVPTRDHVIDWEMVDMVQYAWAFLLDNLDLVEWVTCLFYGESAADPEKSFLEWLGGAVGVATSTAECVSDKIQGKSPDVTLYFTDEVKLFSIDPNPLTGGIISIPLGKIFRYKYTNPFKGAKPGSAEQFCVVADLAATLLHELVHACTPFDNRDAPTVNNKGKQDDNQNTCSTSYLIENSFRWLLWRRYPCLSETSCYFYEWDCMWRNDGQTYLDRIPCWEPGIELQNHPTL